jgi:hypothetical protein
MKKLQYILFGLSILLFTFSACTKETTTEYGQFSLEFDNKVGTEAVSLTTSGSTDYPFATAVSQNFNIQTLGYYISRVELTGPNGEFYSDEVSTGATSEEVKGFYQVTESNASSKAIALENVPLGTYNKITFTIGVEADYVQDGATAGVLDPSNGGWLWNWDSGYIFYKLEGTSPASTRADNTFKFHIGGWKEMTGNTSLVNNVKRITLDFPSSTEVTTSSNEQAHIVMNLLEILDGHHAIDFSATNLVMSPAAGADFAHSLTDAFMVHGIHSK